MRQLVDQQQRRLARQRGIEVEFAPRGAAEMHLQRRQLFQSREQSFGLLAAVQLDVADHDVDTLRALPLRCLEH